MLVRNDGNSAVYIPALGLTVDAGESLDVSDDMNLGGSFVAIDFAAMSVDALRDECAKRGVDVADKARKSDLIKALTGAVSEED